MRVPHLAKRIDRLLAQLRVAPSGHLVGLHLDASHLAVVAHANLREAARVQERLGPSDAPPGSRRSSAHHRETASPDTPRSAGPSSPSPARATPRESPPWSNPHRPADSPHPTPPTRAYRGDSRHWNGRRRSIRRQRCRNLPRGPPPESARARRPCRYSSGRRIVGHAGSLETGGGRSRAAECRGRAQSAAPAPRRPAPAPRSSRKPRAYRPCRARPAPPAPETCCPPHPNTPRPIAPSREAPKKPLVLVPQFRIHRSPPSPDSPTPRPPMRTVPVDPSRLNRTVTRRWSTVVSSHRE